MIKPIKKYRSFLVILLFALSIQACKQTESVSTALSTAQGTEPSVTEDRSLPQPTQTVKAEIPAPTETDFPSTTTSFPKVTITAVKGNLFIRRGPDMAFNPIDVLYKDTSAEVIGRDILSKWVQVKIPNSKKTGWASIQTKYSQLEGNLSALPEITITEWPVPAYLRNCTYHRMYILPGQIYLTSYLGYPENEIWLYPGTYKVYDLDVPGDPVEVLQVSMSEGSDKEIVQDGLGEHRQCP